MRAQRRLPSPGPFVCQLALMLSWLCCFSSSAAPLVAVPANTNAVEWLRQAVDAFQQGKPDVALNLAGKSIAARPRHPQGYFVRGQILSAMNEHEKAITEYDEALKLDPQADPVLQQRGCEHFFLGHIDKSIADFDKYIQLKPAAAPHHWQRGISLYYAGRFTDGRKQFELHQTVNPHDVENAVWHFLCVARESGIKVAREKLIPIEGDARVPMAQVHELFAEKAKPEDVLAAAREGNPAPDRLQQQLFYAHLYLGLYYEALGDEKRTREYIFKAAEKSEPYGYMGAVARVHADILRKAEKKPVPEKEK